MKKSKFMSISIISIILFVCLFLVTLIFYYDIIMIPNNFFKNTSKEYWLWYLNNSPVNNESLITGTTGILSMIFPIIFFLEYMCLLSDEKYKKLIDGKEILINLVLGFTIYLIGFFVIKYIVVHYRLYMIFFPAGVLAIMLSSLIFKLRKT